VEERVTGDASREQHKGVLSGAGDDVAGWIARARAFDAGAWDRLYQLAFPQVYRYVSVRVRTVGEAEDVTEEVFLGALQTVGSLRATSEIGFLAWLFQIARHKIADHLRRQYRPPTEPLDPELDVSDPAELPEDQIIRLDEEQAVRTALAELTDEQREVVVMKFSLGYDNARVASVLGKSPGAINQLQHRALGALRRILERAGR